jgi:hypothetical protein
MPPLTRRACVLGEEEEETMPGLARDSFSSGPLKYRMVYTPPAG